MIPEDQDPHQKESEGHSGENELGKESAAFQTKDINP